MNFDDFFNTIAVILAAIVSVGFFLFVSALPFVIALYFYDAIVGF